MKIWVVALILLSCTPTNPKFQGRRWIIWNVGQGQWVTRVDDFGCSHFDLGGEKFPWSRLQYFCRDKMNQLYISHWDWDHLGGVPFFRKKFPQICLALRPIGAHRRQKFLKNLSSCRRRKKDLQVISGRRQKKSNDQSHVILHKGFLLPGDSPVAQERLWVPLMRQSIKTRVLVLGHHGSRTSTSPQLLGELPNLAVAVASARWKRYRHPHPDVVLKLRAQKVPLLRTEDWGHIHFLE